MNDFYDFSDLRIGMRVNVQGTCMPDGTFTAQQISIKDDGEDDEIEACIDSVDPAASVIRTLGLALHVHDDLEIKDIDKRLLSIEALQPGMRIKTKGRALGDGGFVPVKIKLKSLTPDAMDEIEAEIDDVDASSRSLRVMGFHVVCSTDIEIEA
jgi:hypothetical protein